jgi:hypothetical protein
VSNNAAIILYSVLVSNNTTVNLCCVLVSNNTTMRPVLIKFYVYDKCEFDFTASA